MRYQAEERLEKYRAALVASGEKLKISDVTPPFYAAGQSNAAAVLHLSRLLASPLNFLPSTMKEISPGRARVAWREEKSLETNVWPQLRAVRTNNGAKLAEISQILSANDVQFNTDYEQADLPPTEIDNLSTAKQLAVSAEAAVLLDLHDGNTNEAMENLLLSVEVPKILSRDPLLIDQLVSYAVGAIALAVTWEALQFHGWTDEQLSRLQKAWENQDILGDAVNALAMERAREPMAFDQARRSKKDLEAMIGNGPIGFDEIWQQSLVNVKEGAGQIMDAAASYPRYAVWKAIWSYDDERITLKLSQDMIDALRDAGKHRLALDRLHPEKVESKYEISKAEADPVKRTIERALRARTMEDMVVAAIALERYSLRHHGYPANFWNLIPEFIKHVPIDYMDGKEMRYRRRDDGSYLLYSVATNGVDDGGDPRPFNPEDGASFYKGRDWVWPTTASAEEVKSYEAEEARKGKRKNGR